MPITAAIIVAAGRGTRAGGDVPKQWQMLAGRPVIEHTIAAFSAAPGVGPIVVVLHPDDMARAADLGSVTCVPGGASRKDSVLVGLHAVPRDVTNVLIHDAARPMVSGDLIARVVAALDTHRGAAPGLAITDALWRGDGGRVSGVQPRDDLFAAQTPQGFRLDAILAAHRAYLAPASDDVEVARAFGIEVAIVEGEANNFKITHHQDFARAKAVLGGHMDVRVGSGFDVHRFCEGDQVTLCGVPVPHPQALEGHSDADVAMHAITDAIYGALSAGDIGRHFPPSDPQWKGADSAVFLRHAAGLASERGYQISQLDCTIICEAPKIGPHAGAMQIRLAEITGVAADRISVKATTSEQLGFTGRGEGIAAQATATLIAG
ncbi:MAG: bifunctional 2-C-methyl-D-erythritol 4-phosphate cytidylyltransferase/2-C-methyl-D-erythritol 2,4-cyclodiphosphate synthase [Rhodobacteraceae bacterium]|nr:bifunctional 2-C-methyl-D-erythritol 4-phosphate cytidylyltransferase/2-C-methyl-D-erythritol 2,4-cyclodiphosphate synthase [Paracoccaceae bacterium]